MNGFSSMSGMAGAMDKQTFGAQVVTKTLDYMNNSGQSLAPVDQQTFGASVVNKTLDYMNSGSMGGADMGGMSQTYQFSNDVLGSYMSGKGALADITF